MGKADNYPGNKDVKVPPPVTGPALVEQYARWVADNGIDHLFYDGYDWSRNQGTEPYSRMFGWLRREAKRVDRPIVFSINTGWLGREREWADEWRTSQDINGPWKTILECIATIAEPKPGGHGRLNNPDYVMVGFLPDAEAKSQMSLWCVAGAPLYLSHDFRVLNAWDRYVLLNTEDIAVDQDAATTQGRRLRQQGAAQVWEKRLADGSRAVLLLNAGERALTVGVNWQELGLGDGPAEAARFVGAQESRSFRQGLQRRVAYPRLRALARAPRPRAGVGTEGDVGAASGQTAQLQAAGCRPRVGQHHSNISQMTLPRFYQASETMQWARGPVSP